MTSTSRTPSQTWRFIHSSTGTTGKPRIFPVLRTDLPQMRHVYREHMQLMGIGSDDICTITLTFGLPRGAWSCVQAVESVGATVLPLSSGKVTPAEKLLDVVQTIGATVLQGAGSYLTYLTREAHELGFDTRASGVRLFLSNGEAMTAESRRYLELVTAAQRPVPHRVHGRRPDHREDRRRRHRQGQADLRPRRRKGLTCRTRSPSSAPPMRPRPPGVTPNAPAVVPGAPQDTFAEVKGTIIVVCWVQEEAATTYGIRTNVHEGGSPVGLHTTGRTPTVTTNGQVRVECTFTGLKPGNYTFSVTARNAQGRSGPMGAESHTVILGTP